MKYIFLWRFFNRILHHGLRNKDAVLSFRVIRFRDSEFRRNRMESYIFTGSSPGPVVYYVDGATRDLHLHAADNQSTCARPIRLKFYPSAPPIPPAHTTPTSAHAQAGTAARPPEPELPPAAAPTPVPFEAVLALAGALPTVLVVLLGATGDAGRESVAVPAVTSPSLTAPGCRRTRDRLSCRPRGVARK